MLWLLEHVCLRVDPLKDAVGAPFGKADRLPSACQRHNDQHPTQDAAIQLAATPSYANILQANSNSPVGLQALL